MATVGNISQIQVGVDSYNIVGGLFYGEVDSTSTSTAFTATISNLKTSTLYDGLTVVLKNGIVTSASGFTINVNGLGAKPVYNNMATGNDITPTAPTRDTTIFNINYTMMFIYNSTLVDGGAWICFRGYDSNTNTIGYQLRTNSGNRPMSDTAYRYRLYFTSADGSKWVPANTSTSTNATTSRTFNTRAIDPFGPIVYNSTNDTTNSGARPTVSALWQQYTLTIGYSYVKTLTAWDSVWLKCQPNADGSAIMKDIVQALPTTKDGFIYIFLGFAYSTTAMELNVEHPVYYHDGNGIRLWTGQVIPTKISELTNDSGFITDAGVTSFNGSTGAITYTPPVTSVNGATGAVSISIPGPGIGTTYPIMDGTRSLGTSTGYARVDHVHPTDTSRAASIHSHDVATTAAAGFMSAADKIKLNGIADGANVGTITQVKTTAGAHTTIDVTSGAANFNVPTKTSHLTNDSGFITDADIPEGAAKYTNAPQNIATIAATGTSNAFSPGDHVHAITKATITSVLGSMPTAMTGITISDHNTTTITGVQSSTTSVTGVQATTTTASKITTTTVTIPNVTSAGSASNWVFENITIPIKDTAKTVTGVTAAGSGSFTQGSFSGGSFVQGTDSFTTNVPTKIDTSKFNGGSYSHSGFSGGSFTQGTFNGGSGSFTQGSFNGGSLTMTIDGTDSKKLNIVFTAATHGADSHTHNAATHGNDSYTSAVYGTDNFTAASLASGFYTAGVTAAFTQGADTFTPATHGADSHTHVPPTLATAVTITGVQASTTTASHVKSGGNGSAPTLGTAITVTAVSGNTDVTVPIKATSATTVPIKNTATTTVVTSNTHAVNDSGHAHAY